ncbi:MAG: TIGR01777 family protein, partial [Nevskia sp.]|nr:TIGR01777 family protein [Nevskia sp.]
MHFLISGGSGFIGRRLCAELLEQDHAVTVLTRSPAAAARVLPAGVRTVAETAQVSAADAVVNLAGASIVGGRWSAARKQVLLQSRLQTTQRLLQWMDAAARRPAVLVSASATGYYGPHGDAPLGEDAPAGGDFGAALCQRWEAEALKAEALGVRVCLLRIGIVLGAGGGALASMLPAFRLGLGGPMGDGRQWMSWVHLRDLTALIRWLAQNPQARGAYNGTAPQPVRNRDFARTLARVLRRPALLRTPALALKALFGEMADILLTGQNAPPRRALAEG